MFAAELYRLKVVVWQQPAYVRTFRLVSPAWASYYLLYAAVRAAALTASVEGFALVRAVLGLPAFVLLLAWSVRFATRRLDQPRQGPARRRGQGTTSGTRFWLSRGGRT